MKKLKFGLVCLILPFAFSCSMIKNAVSGNSKQYEMKSPVVDIPRGMKNAAPAPKADDDKAIIVSSQQSGIYYVGNDMFPIDVLGEVLAKRLEKNPDARQMIFLKAGALTECSEIAKILDVLRKDKIEDINLLVESADANQKGYSQLSVKLTSEPKMDDAPNLWANYLLLKIDKTEKITLGNTKDALEIKEKNELKDETEAAAKIAEAFKTRAEKNLKGTNETSKTIIIKSAKVTKYNTLARLVDAAKGAGAETVLLMIDDMEY